MMTKDIVQLVREADLVLVGIGEEFEDYRTLKKIEGYEVHCAWLEESNQAENIPAYNRELLKQSDSKVYKALEQLAQLLEGKNYFVVSVTTNDILADSSLKQDRIVMPCGGSRMLQCSSGCKEALQSVLDEDGKMRDVENGVCPVCGAPLVYNNIYSQNYDENGYLDRWQLYTKWLQGTLFRKLCILELGVGMQCPSVIRFPFEKAGYFNQKASFVRVNAHLYQMTSELGDRGISVPCNAIDWLTEEC